MIIRIGETARCLLPAFHQISRLSTREPWTPHMCMKPLHVTTCLFCWRREKVLASLFWNRCARAAQYSSAIVLPGKIYRKKKLDGLSLLIKLLNFSADCER